MIRIAGESAVQSEIQDTVMELYQKRGKEEAREGNKDGSQKTVSN